MTISYRLLTSLSESPVATSEPAPTPIQTTKGIMAYVTCGPGNGPGQSDANQVAGMSAMALYTATVNLDDEVASATHRHSAAAHAQPD